MPNFAAECVARVGDERGFPAAVHPEREKPGEIVVSRRDQIEDRANERRLQRGIGEVATNVEVAKFAHDRILCRMDGRGRADEHAGGGAPGLLAMPEPAALDPAQGQPPIWAVVLAGGIGTRFWPLASPATPKPVLALVDDRPLVADSVGRLDPLIPADRVLVVTSADIAAAVRAALPSVPVANVLVEDRPLGTAAALAWGATEIHRRTGGQAVVCALHADLGAAFPEALRNAIQRAAGVAAVQRAIVALAIRPSRAETSFGYVEVGAPVDPAEPLAKGGAAEAVRFIEKPGPDVADRLIRAGAYWHSGIVVGVADDLLDALRLYTPEVAAGMRFLASGDAAAFAAASRPIDIERGLLERVGRLLVLAPDIGWDDIGTWASLRRVRALDDAGNGALGAVAFVDATGNIVHADAGAVVLYGVSQLLVVTRPGVTFVTTLDRAADLKPLLDSLPGSARLDPGSLGA